LKALHKKFDMPIVFVNKDVADQFETSYETDPVIHLPGANDKNGWKGKLSTIPLAQAIRWVDRPTQNLIRRKTTIPQTASKKTKEEPAT
jgi:hypothetical protein